MVIFVSNKLKKFEEKTKRKTIGFIESYKIKSRTIAKQRQIANYNNNTTNDLTRFKSNELTAAEVTLGYGRNF